MCKVCTEAVHSVALWTRVTLGPFKPPSSLSKPPSPLEGFKPPSSPLEAPLKPPSSPLEAFRRWSPLEAPFKPPWSPLQAPFTLHLRKASSPLQAPLKPPWSPLQAPLKPPSSPLQAPPSEGEAPLKPSEGEAPFKPSWRVPSKGASLKVKPPSSLKVALPEGPRNLPVNFCPIPALVGSVLLNRWVATWQFVHERSDLPPPSLVAPSVSSANTLAFLAERAYQLLP